MDILEACELVVGDAVNSGAVLGGLLRPCRRDSGCLAAAHGKLKALEAGGSSGALLKTVGASARLPVRGPGSSLGEVDTKVDTGSRRDRADAVEGVAE